jgi:hypothetical protein
LVDFPDAVGTPQESQCHRTADRQQIMRPDRRHAAHRARLASVALAGAAKAGRGKQQIAPTLIIGRHGALAVTARAVDVQLKAVAAAVTDCPKRKLAKHACDVERGRSLIIGLH